MSDPILPFDVWPQQIVQASIPANRNALRAELLASRFLSDTLSEQPENPVEGDAYLVGPDPSGQEWSAFDRGDLTIYKDFTWYAFAPVEGIRVLVDEQEKLFNGTIWIPFGSGGGGGDAFWGGITGNLDDQEDLKEALDGKLESIQAGARISVDNSDPQNPVVNGQAPTWGDVIGDLSDQLDLSAALVEAGETALWGRVDGDLEDQEDLKEALDDAATRATWGRVIGDLEDQADLSQALEDAGETATWGQINGNLNEQTDLKSALDSIEAAARPGAFGVTFDAGTSDLQVGSYGDFVLPWNATLTGWSLIGDAVGTASVQLFSGSFETLPPSKPMSGSNPPALVEQQAERSQTLTGWTTDVSAGTVVRFVLNSVSSGLSRLTLNVTVEKY